MENDDKLKVFFKTRQQTLYKEEWFSRRVMNQLPENAKRKIRMIEIFIWSVSAMFGLFLCFMFGKSVMVTGNFVELFSTVNIFTFLTLISVLGILADQIIKILRV